MRTLRTVDDAVALRGDVLGGARRAVVLGAGLWWTVTIALIRLFGFHRSPAADRLITLLGGITLLIIGAGLLASTTYGLISPGT